MLRDLGIVMYLESLLLDISFENRVSVSELNHEISL
jgi:hypothetical protein